MLFQAKGWKLSLMIYLAMIFHSMVGAAPVIDGIGNVVIPAGKSLIVPITATSPNGRPLTYTVFSSTNAVAVVLHTNNPFWKISVAQVAPANAPGAFQTPFRGGVQTVTNIGDMTFMLFPEYAPHTVDVFKGLTQSGFYTTNTIFHRVISGFMIQGGDPLTNGTGGPVFRYDDEWNPQAIFSGSGQLALANSGKDTDGSQFFVTVAPYRSGDFQYTIFGQLVRGSNVLSTINHTVTDTNDRPLATVIITQTSFVSDASDIALTLITTNRTNVTGTVTLIADNGAGEKNTNSFTVTTVTDAFNDQSLLFPNTTSNLIDYVNGSLTNIVTALDLEGDSLYWYVINLDINSTNSTGSLNNGQLQWVTVPNTNFVGSSMYYFVVAPFPYWNYYPFSTWFNDPSHFPYARQKYTFTFGDTPIAARGTDFAAAVNTLFTNQPLATFTNGVSGSAVTHFVAAINWGDNTTNNGVIITNATGLKTVLGAHTYAQAGTYPIYVTIQSQLGVAATVVSTANIPPSLTLTVTGTNDLLTWPAWATEYQLQFTTNLADANWQTASNFPVLNGYTMVVTNAAAENLRFYRLMK